MRFHAKVIHFTPSDAPKLPQEESLKSCDSALMAIQEKSHVDPLKSTSLVYSINVRLSFYSFQIFIQGPGQPPKPLEGER